jgi:type IV pilus assembly protein PilB
MEEPSAEDYQLSERDLRAIELMETKRAWPPLAHRERGVNVIDLVDAPYDRLPAHRTILLLMLQLSVKDRATELRFEPCPFTYGEDGVTYHEKEGGESIGIRMSYEVDGHVYDLVPPPHDMLPHLAREIETLSGLDGLRLRAAHLLRRFAGGLDGQAPGPRRGRFALRIGDHILDVDVIADPGEWGERYFLRFGPIAPGLSDKAQAAMKRIFEGQHA